MPCEILIPEGQSYILVRPSGPFTRELAISVAKEASDLSRRTRIKRFLYDMRTAPNVESTLANYKYAYEDMPRLELDRSARVAILAASGDESHRFIETVSRNAGYGVRLFFDEKDALAFLGDV